ncbi:conserved hypothetical protein, partial [Ricinus communis]
GDRLGADPHLGNAAVLASPLRVELHAAAADDLGQPRHNVRPVELGIDVRQREAGELLPGIAQAVAGGVVEFDEGQGFDIDERDRIRRLRHDGPIDLLPLVRAGLVLAPLHDAGQTVGQCFQQLPLLDQERAISLIRHVFQIADHQLTPHIALHPQRLARALDHAVKAGGGVHAPVEFDAGRRLLRMHQAVGQQCSHLEQHGVERAEPVFGDAEYRVQAAQFLHPLGQCKFRLPHRRDIARHAEHAHQTPVAVGHRRLGGLEQPAVAVIAEGEPLFVGQRLSGCRRGPVVGAEEVRKFTINEFVVGMADQFGFGMAIQTLEARIAEAENAIGVLQPHQVRHGVEQHAQAVALLVERGRLGVGQRAGTAQATHMDELREQQHAHQQQAAAQTHHHVRVIGPQLSDLARAQPLRPRIGGERRQRKRGRTQQQAGT